MICCHQPGQSHLFYRNIFAFAAQPALGWQSSAFRENWYGTLTELPQDAGARTGSPIDLNGLPQRLQESEECRHRIWDQLAKAVGTADYGPAASGAVPTAASTEQPISSSK